MQEIQNPAVENKSGSVTTWFSALKAGDQDAAQKLWERYFQRLVGLARAKLKNTSTCGADEEDVALSAFHSFWRGATKGRFPKNTAEILGDVLGGKKPELCV